MLLKYNKINIKNYNMQEAIVFNTHNVTINNNIVYYPIYMLMFLDESSLILPKIEKIDFSTLK